MNTYIHIGYPKTATKFLQFEIFPKLDLDYFFVGKNPKGKYRIMRRILDDIRKPNNLYITPYYKEQVKRITDKSKHTLISFESLIGDIYNPDIRDMRLIAQRLSTLFPSPKILLCIREEKSMIKSLYSQYIKEGGTLTSWEFENIFFNRERLNYVIYISQLQGIFGKKNVCIIDFELLETNDKKFVETICTFMNQPIPEFGNKKINLGYSKKQLELQRFLNSFFKTQLNPNGLPPQKLWNYCHPAKNIVNNRIIRRLLND